MTNAPTLYQWLGLSPLPEHPVDSASAAEGDAPPPRRGRFVNLEPILAEGGEWRRRLLIRLTQLTRHDRVVFRIIGGDALLADGQVGHWRMEHPGNNSPLYKAFQTLHDELGGLGKPWMPELSPCQPGPLTTILEQLGIELHEVSTAPQTFITRIGPDTGPWARHLSDAEIKWLRQFGTTPRHDTLPLSCSVTHMEGRLASGSKIRTERAASVVLSSVLDANAVHTDRWPTRLPRLDLNAADDGATDADVRLLFRAIASRIGQNGRLCPGHHRYLVMNLWEPDHDGVDAGTRPKPEGRFAKATEFVFAVPDVSEPMACAPERVLREALRTITYLALVATNGDNTLHSVTQHLFTRRRPLLRVGPARGGERWEITSESGWASGDPDGESLSTGTGQFVPMGVTVRYPHVRTYERLYALLAQHIDLESGSAARAFEQTIWCVSTDGFFAFPWDSQDDYIYDPRPAFLGKAAAKLVYELQVVMKRLGETIWEELGATAAGEEAFVDKFNGALAGSGTEVRFPEAKWMYRALLATSVFFDDADYEHRQMSLPIAYHGGVFLAAGTYMITHRHAAPDSTSRTRRLDMFSDAVARFYSVQIAGHAARSLLSISAMRMTRRMVMEQSQRKVAEERRRSEQQVQKGATDAIRDLAQSLDAARRSLLPLLGLPGAVWKLWDKSPPRNTDDNWLNYLTHALALKDARRRHEQILAGIKTVLADADPEVIAYLKHQIAWLVSAADDDEFEERKNRFKGRLRAWSREGDTLVTEVFTDLNDPPLSLFPDSKLEYPSIPTVWARCLREIRSGSREVTRTALQIAPFIVEDMRGVRPGFVTISYEAEPPRPDAAARLRSSLEKQIGAWADVRPFSVTKGHCNLTSDLPSEVIVRVSSLVKSQPLNGVVTVLSGVPLMKLR